MARSSTPTRAISIGGSTSASPSRIWSSAGAIPHHLIDILPPDGEMTLARYQDLA